MRVVSLFSGRQSGNGFRLTIRRLNDIQANPRAALRSHLGHEDRVAPTRARRLLTGRRSNSMYSVYGLAGVFGGGEMIPNPTASKDDAGKSRSLHCFVKRGIVGF